MEGQFKKSPCTWLVRFPTTLYKVKWGTRICHDMPSHIKTALPRIDPGSLNCNWFIATFLASWLHVTLHSVGPIGTIAWKKTSINSGSVLPKINQFDWTAFFHLHEPAELGDWLWPEHIHTVAAVPGKFSYKCEATLSGYCLVYLCL